MCPLSKTPLNCLASGVVVCQRDHDLLTERQAACATDVPNRSLAKIHFPWLAVRCAHKRLISVSQHGYARKTRRSNFKYSEKT